MLKEKKMVPGIIFIVVIAVLCCGFCFFRNRKYQPVRYAGKADLPAGFAGVEMERAGSGTTYVEGEVIFQADSEEEAQRVADSVNSQLKSWQNGIAVISIEGTVSGFLKKYSGTSGLPEMYPNYIYFTN